MINSLALGEQLAHRVLHLVEFGHVLRLALDDKARCAHHNEIDVELRGVVRDRYQLGGALRRRGRVVSKSQMDLGQVIVARGKHGMYPQVQLLINLNGRLERFERLSEHLVLLVGDGQLIPGEYVLGAQLLLQLTVGGAVLVDG